MKLSSNLIWLCLLIVGALTSCAGSAEEATPPPESAHIPNKVQIQVFAVDQQTANKTVIIEQVDQVKKFYQTVSAMPPYPRDAMCTMEMGPHYILIFSQDNKEMMTVTAERYGCKKLIVGKDDLRQGTQQFWQELDQLITKTP